MVLGRKKTSEAKKDDDTPWRHKAAKRRAHATYWSQSLFTLFIRRYFTGVYIYIYMGLDLHTK